MRKHLKHATAHTLVGLSVSSTVLVSLDCYRASVGHGTSSHSKVHWVGNRKITALFSIVKNYVRVGG